MAIWAREILARVGRTRMRRIPRGQKSKIDHCHQDEWTALNVI